MELKLSYSDMVLMRAKFEQTRELLQGENTPPEDYSELTCALKELEKRINEVENSFIGEVYE